MLTINDYSEYLAVLRIKSSKDPAMRDEVKKALDVLQKEDPSRYTLYQELNGEIKPPKKEAPNKERKVSKEEYIKEHPEINVSELRRKARERLKKGFGGYNLSLELPVWLSEDELLRSIERLTISDLITASGKPVPRQTLLKKCTKLAVSDKRIDETKLRDSICGMFCSFYNRKIITLRTASLYGLVRKFILEEAKVEELVKISDGSSLYIGELATLIHKKESEFSEEQLRMMQRKDAAIAEKKARRKERQKAKKRL